MGLREEAVAAAMEVSARDEQRAEETRRRRVGRHRVCIQKAVERRLGVDQGELVFEQQDDVESPWMAKVTLEDDLRLVAVVMAYRRNQKGNVVEMRPRVELFLADACDECNKETPRNLPIRSRADLGRAIGGSGEAVCPSCRQQLAAQAEAAAAEAA